jgi:septal ring factor EnvC (AmiA/AmiB activator)
MYRLACIGFLSLLIPFSGFAQSRRELEKKRKKVQEEIQYTRGILQKTSAQKSATLHKIGALNRIIDQQAEVIKDLNTELSEADKEINQQNETLEQLKASYQAERLKLRKTVLKAYKGRKSANQLAFVFAASSFRQAVRRMYYLSRLSDFRKQQIGLLESKAAEVKNGLETLEEVRQEKNGILLAEKQEKQQLETDKQQKTKLVQSLAGKEAELRKKIKQNEKAVAKLNSAISAMIAREIAAAKKRAREQTGKDNTTTTASARKTAGGKSSRASGSILLTPEARLISDNFETGKGSLPWPVERGYISQYFGVHAHPDLAGITLVNNGVDITTSGGSTARAVFKGTVSAILEIPGQEKAVLLNHGEYYTVYSRLSQVYVSRGQQVEAKQALGTVWTDDESKTILQFQLWQGQSKLNPAGWLTSR